MKTIVFFLPEMIIKMIILDITWVIPPPGYEYRDSVGKKQSWLDEAQRLAMEHPEVDSLEDARAYLHEHEVS